jgi:glucose-6-phosphate 1-dehydrogenase
MEKHKRPFSSLIFIFGGSGDLNQRKLTPALFNLYIDDFMPAHFAVVGIGRTPYTNEGFSQHLHEGAQKHSRRKPDDATNWADFAKHLSYLQMDVDDETAYDKIAAITAEKEAEWGHHPNVVFYLAVAPQLVAGIAPKLGALNICADTRCTRIVVEKPFGHDLASAKALNTILSGMFDEEQIYRIDHYLGKETVQNILALRFANALFEPIWNAKYIDHVQITASETVGVEGRGSYYEQSGALRDMVQNHMLQLMCMIGMEAPVNFAPNEIRNKKADVLHAIRKWRPDEVHENAVRGQYGHGWMQGAEVPGYRQEKGVEAESETDTYAAARFFIDNWRWQGVPFYVRTGKRLFQKNTLIAIQFKEAPSFAFPPESSETWRHNRLTISITPDSEIRLRFQAKRPGQQLVLSPVDMVFSYKHAYTDEHQEPEAYETLLLDVMEGNPTLFMRADQVEAAWEVITPILDAWTNREAVDFPNYAPNSWGPQDADAMLAKDGNNWYNVAIGES